MIVYTRWDYVDRNAMVAHHPWINDARTAGTPGRSTGTTRPARSAPTWSSTSCAIPGSHRFVATAAPHHGQAFGSLVVIDPRVPDDDKMSAGEAPHARVGFPESQGGTSPTAKPGR